MSLSNKVYKSFGKIDLKDYVMNFLKTHEKTSKFGIKVSLH